MARKQRFREEEEAAVDMTPSTGNPVPSGANPPVAVVTALPTGSENGNCTKIKF